MLPIKIENFADQSINKSKLYETRNLKKEMDNQISVLKNRINLLENEDLKNKSII